MVNSGFLDANKNFGANSQRYRYGGRQIPPVNISGDHHVPINFNRLIPQAQTIHPQNNQMPFASSSQPDSRPNGPINISDNFTVFDGDVPLSYFTQPIQNASLLNNNRPMMRHGQNLSQMNGSVLDAMSFGPVGPNGQRTGFWTGQVQSQLPVVNVYEERQTQGIGSDNLNIPENLEQLIQAQMMNSGSGAQGNGFLTPIHQNRFRPVIYRDVTYTTRIVLESVQEAVNNSNQVPNYGVAIGAGFETPQRPTQTDNVVIDAAPISYMSESTSASFPSGHVQTNNPIGMTSNPSMNNNAQSFEPIGQNGQRFGFSTPRAQFPRTAQGHGEQPTHRRDKLQPQRANYKSKKQPNVRFSSVVLDKGNGPSKFNNVVTDAVPVSYIPPVQGAATFGVNDPKNKGKSPLVWEEPRVNQSTGGQQNDWRQLPLVIYGAGREHSSQIIDAIPLSFRVPEFASDDDEDDPYYYIPGQGRKKLPIDERLALLEQDEELQRNWMVEARERLNSHIDLFYHHRIFNLKCRSKCELRNFEDNGVSPRGLKNLSFREEPLTVKSEIFGPEGSYSLSPSGKSVLTSAGTRNMRFNSPAYLKNLVKSKAKQTPLKKPRVADNKRNGQDLFSQAFVRRVLSAHPDPTIMNRTSSAEGEAIRRRRINESTSVNTGVKAEKGHGMVASPSNSKPIIISPKRENLELGDVSVKFEY